MPEDPIICTACGREMTPGDVGRFPPLCPHCGAMLIIDDHTDEAPDDSELDEQEELELEGQRIQQIVRSRRAVVRTRGWYIAAAIACLVLAVQEIIWLIAAMRLIAWNMEQTARLSLAVVLLALVVIMGERIGRLSAELHRRSLPEPMTPPDFSSLSDGSQQARNLEKLEDDGESPPQ
jgi:hypothetical protein